MMKQEQNWDNRLQISTIGRDASHADEYRFPYEPTPYCVLQRLAESGLIGEGSTVLDYGCGKGRVDFFLSCRAKAEAIGIEYDPQIFDDAIKNQKTALPGIRTNFVLTSAEEYPVPPQVDRCYFFNPFSAQLLHKAMARILDSYYEVPRQILLFFYYPSDDYISYLMTVEELDFYDEISCQDLFPNHDPRERILIFSLPGQ